MLNEKYYLFHRDSEATADSRLAEVVTFFTEILAPYWATITYDADNSIFWFNEEQTVGIKATVSSSYVNLYVAVKNEAGVIVTYSAYNHQTLVSWCRYHYHISKDHDVLYFGRQPAYVSSSDNISDSCYWDFTIVFAKDENGKVRAFWDDYTTDPVAFCVNSYRHTIEDVNNPFIIEHVVGPDNAKFPNLYKLLYLTSFDRNSTIISVDGAPYRVVASNSSGSGSSSSMLDRASFAFPVSTEDD